MLEKLPPVSKPLDAAEGLKRLSDAGKARHDMFLSSLSWHSLLFSPQALGGNTFPGLIADI
jgi:hypothetical protein